MTNANIVTTLAALAFMATPWATSIAAEAASLDAQAKSRLQRAVANPQRTDANRARDQYRHPVETLEFFGIRPTDTVVEIWPGGGWYTEILASYLADGGKLIVASASGRGSEGINKRLDANQALFGKVERANFPTLLGGTGAGICCVASTNNGFVDGSAAGWGGCPKFGAVVCSTVGS